MIRLLGALSACALAVLPTTGGTLQAAHEPGDLREVVVTLTSPPLAGDDGSAHRALVDREQATFARRPSRGNSRCQHPLALSRGTQRRRCRRAGAIAPGARADSRRRDRRRRNLVCRRFRLDDRRSRRGAPLAGRPAERWRRGEDRDHRRRRRSASPVPVAGGLHDAARLSQGAGVVHDGEGDRGTCVRARVHDLAVRAFTLRPGAVAARNPRRRHRRGERGHGRGLDDDCRGRAAGVHRKLQGALRPDRR